MATFNLAKLSYADEEASSVQNCTWTHVTNDLVAVFDSFRSRGPPSLVMKVLQARRLLFEIPVEDLVNEGKQFLQSLARGHTAQVTSDQLPISAIVRCPLFALRYHVRNGKARRIQLKFASDQEYDAAFERLRQLGLHISSQKSSASSTPGPSCPPSQLSEISNRPSTAGPAAASSLHYQLQEATVPRPASARPLQRDPLVPPVYFPRPDSASSLSGRDRFPTLPSIDENRPMSTSHPEAFYPRPDSSGSGIPPRRELPFQRSSSPRSSEGDDMRPHSRSSILMGPPPLPASTRKGSSSRPQSSYDTELPPLPEPTVIRDDAKPQSGFGPREPLSDISNKPSPFRPSTAQGTNIIPLTSSPPPYRPSTSSGPTHTPSLMSLSTGSSTRHNFDNNSVLLSPLASEATYRDPPAFQSDSSAADSTGALATYAMQSDDGRMAALNNFIIQHLEDDNFLTLVEDMDMCWARIAPGQG